MNGSNQVTIAILLTCLANYVPALLNENRIWLWRCDPTQKFCTRTLAQATNSSDPFYPSIEICRLTCGKYGSLWPQPTINTTLSTQLIQFSIKAYDFDLRIETGSEARNYMQAAIDVFLQSLSLEDTLNCPQTNNKVTVTITVTSKNMNLDWNTNESYTLRAKTEGNQNSVQILAETVYGARHALETLSQLTEFYPNNGRTCLAMVTEAQIADKPAFPHRGLLLDTARNFQSIELIKKHIDGMGSSKLNVLHWHITDSQSFPLELPSLPNMTKYGAYSADKTYHPADIADLISYAKVRGVRIIIEIDAPAHAGNGWQWGPEAGLGDLAVCIDQQPWRSFCIQPPCGQLNPVNSNLYNILKMLYGDIVNMLPKGEIFHMGGDEVFVPCWNSTPEIVKFIGNKSRTQETFLDLWSSYQKQALEAYDGVVGNSDTPIVLWTSHLTEVAVIEKYLPKDRYVIQTWVPAADNLPKNLLALGYRIIVSTKDAWYLDHGFWGGTAYHNWQTVYNNRIPLDNKTLGGEVCMWGEYVDDSSVEPRVWPRAAAAAERLWSNPRTTNQVAQRFYRHRERLVARGIQADALIPRWCYQNEGQC